MKENADKARALGEPELAKKLHDDAEQMFRLRFQLSMGQTDGLKKLRTLRRERARMLTIRREREIGQKATAAATPAPVASVKAKKPAAKKAVKPAEPAVKTAAVKKAPAKKTAARAKKA